MKLSARTSSLSAERSHGLSLICPYKRHIDTEDYEDAADFLEMAARLIYIKTCSLLPHDEESRSLI